MKVSADLWDVARCDEDEWGYVLTNFRPATEAPHFSANRPIVDSPMLPKYKAPSRSTTFAISA